MLSEAIIGGIAEAVIGYALEQSGLGDRVRAALGRDPVRRAYATALGVAIHAVEESEPLLAGRLFDASFFQHEARPVLAQLLWRHGQPTGTQLAAAWADSLRLQGKTQDDALANMTPTADRFLATLKDAAMKQADLQEVFDHRAAERTAGAGERTADHTAVLPEMLDLFKKHLPPAQDGRNQIPVPTVIPFSKTERLVGRDDELNWVCERLRAGNMAALCGIGGIGKTELAIAAAKRLESHFQGRIVWLECGPNDIFAIQERMAAALGVVLEQADLAIRRDILAAAWKQQPATLVVLDDLRHGHLARWDLVTPQRPPCILLITSRRTDLPVPPSAVLSLHELNPLHSIELLTLLLPTGWVEAEREAAQEVVELLEHVPLALTLAARRAIIIAGRRVQSGGADADIPRRLIPLLAELRKARLQVLNQSEDPSRADLSVVITFRTSFDDLGIRDQLRFRWLGVFARREFDLMALQAIWQDRDTAIWPTLQELMNAGLLSEIAEGRWSTYGLLHDVAVQLAAEEVEAKMRHAEFYLTKSGAETSEQRSEFLKAASFTHSRAQSILPLIPLEHRNLIELNLAATAQLIEWTRGYLK